MKNNEIASNIYNSPDGGGEFGGETGGNIGQRYLNEFMECKSEEPDTAFEKVEPTVPMDANDRQHIDTFLTIRGGLPCAVDIAAQVRNSNEHAQRIERKQAHQSIIPFKTKHDENGRPISENMPFFVIDGVDLDRWHAWGREADEEGVPITDIMTQKEQDEQYRFVLGKIWEQCGIIYREGTNDQRKKIEPYRRAIKKEFEKILSPEEFKLFSTKA